MKHTYASQEGNRDWGHISAPNVLTFIFGAYMARVGSLRHVTPFSIERTHPFVVLLVSARRDRREEIKASERLK